MNVNDGIGCRFCGGDEDDHRPDCSGYTNLFPAPPGMRCARCGQPVADVFCMEVMTREGYQLTMEVLFADRDPAEAIALCVGCHARETLLDLEDPGPMASGTRWE